MSKLTINKSITNFLNRSKVRFAALGTATIMATTMTACTYNHTEVSISTPTKEQQDLKAHILDYITNMDVYKNEGVGGYYIHEQLYEDAPGIARNENGELVEADRNFIGYSQFFVSFEEAELLELTELLESKITYNIKTK